LRGQTTLLYDSLNTSDFYQSQSQANHDYWRPVNQVIGLGY